MSSSKNIITLGALLCGLVLSLIATTPTYADQDLEVSGWVPYWTSTAPKAAKKHLSVLEVIHPFGYSIKSDGSLLDNMNITKGSWKALLTEAKKRGVLVVPTITTSNGPLVHELLSDPDKREEHIDQIIDLVKKHKFAGIDIDYEGKFASTNPYFAQFLEELKDRLGSKRILSCTIEARTPPESLYRTMPETIEYANDYDAINEHCDRVNIMAYDQQRADIKLNDERLGEPYIPVADTEWVRKVLELTLETIDADKVVLGIASYGHEYEVLVTPDRFAEYRRIGAYNPPSIEKKARAQKVTPERATSGELAFSYLALGKHAPQYNTKVPRGTDAYLKAAAQSLAYTNETGVPTVFSYVTWSDAGAMKEKIELAKEFGILGVALFKIDGQEDKKVWKEL